MVMVMVMVMVIVMVVAMVMVEVVSFWPCFKFAAIKAPVYFEIWLGMKIQKFVTKVLHADGPGRCKMFFEFCGDGPSSLQSCPWPWP